MFQTKSPSLANETMGLSVEVGLIDHKQTTLRRSDTKQEKSRSQSWTNRTKTKPRINDKEKIEGVNLAKSIEIYTEMKSIMNGRYELDATASLVFWITLKGNELLEAK